MGCKVLPDSLGIHVIKVFPHNGLAHITEETSIENTKYKIIFQPEQFQAICITSGPIGWLKDFLTVMGSSSH